MTIDNIPPDNYCGIILKAEEQEDKDIYGNIKWRRIYLWVDIAKGLYQGYFSGKYEMSGKKEWQGVMSLYLPTTDNCSSTDDVTTYQRYKKNIDIIMQYNKLDKVPTILDGLLVPIQIYKDDVGATKIKNYCCSYNYQIDTTFADADISHYAQIDDIQYYSPRANLSNALTPTVVSNNSISPAKSIAERRRQRASQSSQPTNIPPILASPPASPAPQLIVRAVSAEQAVSILQSMYGDRLVSLYKRYLATNFLPPAPNRDSNSLEILYNRLNQEFREVCFSSITNLQSYDIEEYDKLFSDNCQYQEYMVFQDKVNNIIGKPVGQYCRLFKYLSAYQYRYFANYNFSTLSGMSFDKVINLNDDKTENYMIQKQFRKLMYDVIYPNSIVDPLWLIDNIPVKDFYKNTYGLAIDSKTGKIRFRVEEEVFGMTGYKGVDKKTGLSIYN